MRKFIIAAIATGLLLLFFERSNMATTNIVGQSADVRSVRPDRWSPQRQVEWATNVISNVFAQPRRCAGGSAKQQKQRRAMDEVAADTVAIIAKRVPADKRNLSMTDRLEDLNIDSFSAVEMIYDLEEKFDVEFPYNSNDNWPEQLQTVGDLVEAIKKLLGGWAQRNRLARRVTPASAMPDLW
jgi:acyl carrier protein